MTKITKWLLLMFAFVLSSLFGQEALSQTINAASCNASDVQNAINSASESETVNIPSCPSGVSWTSGVSISGKGITLAGAGGGRIIAVDVETSAISIGTGTKTFGDVTNDMGATAYLSATAPPISTGETLLIYENGFLGNYMKGTVTSFSGSTLVMNITSSGGTCGASAPANTMQSNCKRWLITTLPSTVLVNNLTSGNMITVTEDTSYDTTITGIQFAQGSSGGGAGETIFLQRNNSPGSCSSTACAVLIHDNFFESNQADIIDGNTNRGVVWDNSFMFSPFSLGQYAAIRIQDGNNTQLGYSWNSASTMGTADTTGQSNLYLETNDLHAASSILDISDDARMVIRYNVFDNAGGSSHGGDTGFIGMRHFEFYNNAGIFESYSDGTTAAMTWWIFVRGGTFAWHDNTLPQISSTDWGTKGDIILIEMPLQRDQGSFPCWGAGFTTAGQYYPRPHQVGFGYVTGTGTATYPPLGFNSSQYFSNTQNFAGSVYVGDSEPAYIWNNNRSMSVGVNDYCSSTLGGYNCGGQPTYCPNTPEPDVAADYIQSGRDYFNGTAKPSYTPYTYPHPLTAGQGSGNPPAAPTSLTATVQ